MEKRRILIEVIIVLVILVIAVVKDIPNLKKELGSSDKLLISVKDTKDIIILNIDNTSVGLTISNENKITNLIFLTEKTINYHNKDIEKKEVEKGIKEIINISIANKILKDQSVITIDRYKGTIDIKSILENNIKNINYTYNEKEKNLQDLAREYNINSSDESEILVELIMKSKDYIRNIKNTTTNTTNYKEKADYVYKKLEKYKEMNNITNEDKDKHQLDIILIPTDETASNYPTSNSYYEIKENKVFAYIEIEIDEKTVSYCYNGSIENYKEGSCG